MLKSHVLLSSVGTVQANALSDLVQRLAALTIAFYRGMARFVVAHPAVVPNGLTRALVLAGIGAAATVRAVARSALAPLDGLGARA